MLYAEMFILITAIRWLNDLFDVLVDSHVEIGCDVAEIQGQKQEHQSFQETAKGTYEYGCQLVNGARVLRISCKLELEGNTRLMARLRQAWRQLRSVGQEQLTRLRVCAVFHRNVTDHCLELREMIETVSSLSSRRSRSVTPSVSTSPEVEETIPSRIRPKAEIRDILSKREKLLPEVGRMVRLGRLLRSRLKEPLALQKMQEMEGNENGGNLSAVQSISAKLLEVTRLAEKLDAKLCEAGARSRALNPSVEEEGHNNEEEIKNAEMLPRKDIQEDIGEIIVATDEKNVTLEEPLKKVDDQNFIKTERSIAEESTVEEYVTATECSSTPVPRSRSESFLSSEYDDVPVSTTCHKMEDDSIKKNDTFPKVKCETAELKNSNGSGVNEYSPDGATVIQRTMKEHGGKIIKEVTETTTLRVTQDTHFGVASYKLESNTITDHTESLDYHELQDLNQTVHNNEITTQLPLKTNCEEHTYNSGDMVLCYEKSTATSLNGLETVEEIEEVSVEDNRGTLQQLSKAEEEFLRMVKSVSEELEECTKANSSMLVSIQQQQCQRIAVACTSAAAVVEELTIMPAAIAIYELN